MFTLITNYKHQSMVIKTVINNDRTKIDITSCLHPIATPSLIVSGIYKNYYTCEMILQNIRTYRIQYISNMYTMHKVACGI